MTRGAREEWEARGRERARMAEREGSRERARERERERYRERDRMRERDTRRRAPSPERWRRHGPLRSPSPERRSRRRSPSPEGRGAKRRKWRSPSPERRPAKPPSIAAQYDDLFKGMDWYTGADGAKPGGTRAAAEEGSSPDAGSSSADVARADEPESPRTVEASKESLLLDFLSGIGAEAEPAEPAPAAEPATSGAPVIGPSIGPVGPAHDAAAPRQSADAAAVAAARPAGARLASASGGRRGRRWRLHEMVGAQVGKVLRRLGLGVHAAAFERDGIDGGMCDFLDDEMLEHQLGMGEEHRRVFLRWVESMRPPGSKV